MSLTIDPEENVVLLKQALQALIDVSELALIERADECQFDLRGDCRWEWQLEARVPQ